MILQTIAATTDPQVAYHAITAALADKEIPLEELLLAIESGTPNYFALPLSELLSSIPNQHPYFSTTDFRQNINQARINLINLLGKKKLCPPHVLQSAALGWIKTSRLFDTNNKYNGKYIVSALCDCTDYSISDLPKAGFTPKQIKSLM
jgi:hypothetical protein